jgi:catechol 2,3-dioxygenase-like lactoylglutathione lyase family enzyme
MIGAVMLAAGGDLGANDNVRQYLWQAGMAPSEIGEINVFRRFSSDRRAAMETFYARVLALAVLPSTALGGGQMIRYPIGASEVKLFPSDAAPANRAGVGEMIGVRLLTFFYADEAAVTARFVEHGHAAPQFRSQTSHAGATRAALVQDPDGEWVELVIVPGASAATLTRFEIGITVADIDRSRAFYRDFMGFDEVPPVRDALIGATRHAYRHGSTTITLWSFGADLPADTQTGGMQYIVWNAAAVNDVAQARAATIDRPLSAPGQMRTIWLLDPDGVSNYFAEFAGHDNTPP